MTRKKLKALAALVEGAEIIQGSGETVISDMVQDSRQATRGALFVCLEGAHVDGHTFIASAAAKGAVAIITERRSLVNVPTGLAVLCVPSIDAALQTIAPAFFDSPAQQLRLIGITGTNGKTTTSYLVRDMLAAAGHRVGLIGTLQILIGDEAMPTHNTTPTVVDLQRTLAKMVEAGCEYAVMEVSSHALAQNRVAGCEFDVAVFTNLTQDHLDFHKTMDAYCAAKARLFDNVSAPGIKPGKTAIVNVDDPRGATMLRHVGDGVGIMRYGLDSLSADLRAVEVRVLPTGSSFVLQGGFGRLRLSLKITGRFNVYNVLGATAAALAEGVSVDAIERTLADFRGVPGRFELIDCGQPFAVVVDYAHTPDGLENILRTARQITPKRIITVFGCGGDRDKTKRPIMGRLAAELSDVVLVTSDNPRSEDPAAIIADIMAGVEEKIGVKPYEQLPDRREAIFVALAMAQPGDTVVIAGKGHETYQILGDTTIRFDDREVAREALFS